MPKAVRRQILAARARTVRRRERVDVGSLAENVVSKRMLALYTEHCGRFARLAFGIDFILRHAAAEDVDDALSTYVEILWQEGEPKSWASCTLAGVQHFAPRLRRHIPAAWRLRGA